MKKLTICKDCKRYGKPSCWVRKQDGKDPQPGDMCAGGVKRKGAK